MEVPELVFVIALLSPALPNPSPPSSPPWTLPSSSNSSSIPTPAIPPIFSKPPRPNVPSPLPPIPPSPSRVTSLHQFVSTISTEESSWILTISNWANSNKTDTNIERLLKGKSCPPDSYSCRGRCGHDERSAPPTPFCFCDRVCSAYGDCCYDYTARCSAYDGNTKRNVKSKCIATDRSLRYGYIAVDSCPVEWKKFETFALCMNNTTDDLLSELPVFDWNNFTLYKNVFCAFCNRAENISYWGLQAHCGSSANLTEMNFHSLITFVKEGCNLSFSRPISQKKLLKKCTPQEHQLENSSASKRNLTTEKLCSICNEYSMEWCFKKKRFRNPHCLLCHGELTDVTDFTESYCCQSQTPVLPPLSILFDFQSTTKYLIKAKTRRNTRTMQVEMAHKCSRREVYDPFSDTCREIHVKIILKNETFNCTGLTFKPQEYQLFSNSSVFIPSHGRNYDEGAYVSNGTFLVLCTNLTYNLSRPMIREEMLHFLHLATYTGSAVSLVALVMLLLTYFCNSELRNLPGKITICLASSLLVSHVLYFVMNYSDVRPLCTTIGVLMHYWLLATFLWMNAMAVCVHGTFTNQVNVVRVGHGSSAGDFTRYSIYAWITPLVIVGSCVIYDTVTTGSIGYGTGMYCFIQNKTALLCTLVAPVGIILLFNFFALARTLHHLGKIQKETSATLSQSHKPNLTIICLKITSALGLTWVLGILAAFRHTAFLWYPFVVCNSLQGFFLFVSFVLNRRALALIRAKLGQRKRDQRSGLYLEETRGVRKTAKEDNSLKH